MGDNTTSMERLASLETKVDQVLREITELRESFRELERMKVELRLIKTIGIWIFAPILGTVGSGVALAVFYALRWHH